MKKEFIGKTICFLGASNLAHGHYMYDMRSYISRQDEKCIIYNRGVPGNRADMAEPLLDDEIFSLKPDYCVILFGCNDLGIWLYDSFNKETPELFSEREKRVDSFKNGVKNIVKRCKENGVKPIVSFAAAVNQKLTEKPDIPTLADNAEKKVLLGPWFYKRKTFENINDKYKEISAWLKEYVREENLIYFDFFEKTYENMLREKDLFAEDGIHYSLKGHSLNAKALLECLGYENVPCEFIHDEANDNVFKIEARERSIKFIPYNSYNATLGNFTKDEIVKGAEKIASDPESPCWLKNSAVNYLKYLGKEEELKQDVVKAVKEYLGF